MMNNPAFLFVLALLCSFVTHSGASPDPTIDPSADSAIACPSGFRLAPSGSCEPCPLGTTTFFVFANGSSTCDPCYPGSFQNQTGQSSCIPCPPGTSSQSGASSCTACPDGQVLLKDSTCGVCPPGQSLSEFDELCEDCAPGFFKAEAGVGPCLPCPYLSHSATGAASCTECAENEALLADGTCGACPPGMYYESFSMTCEQCRPGSFTDYENVLTSCLPCGGNSFSLEGATECIECPRGQTYMRDSRSCETCAPGTSYSRGLLQCLPCNVNQFSRGPGAQLCESCAPNSFARERSTTCFACERGSVYIVAIDACGSCAEGERYFAGSCEDVSKLPRNHFTEEFFL